jgi:hypothetical protein
MFTGHKKPPLGSGRDGLISFQLVCLACVAIYKHSLNEFKQKLPHCFVHDFGHYYYLRGFPRLINTRVSRIPLGELQQLECLEVVNIDTRPLGLRLSQRVK